MKKPSEMKTFDIDPLFDILDYAEALEKLSVGILRDYLKQKETSLNMKMVDLEKLLKSRGVLK